MTIPLLARRHDSTDGATPVLYAMYRHRFELAKALADAAGTLDLAEAAAVDDVAEVNAKQAHGWTPLHSAAANGDGELVDRLVAAGADPAATNDDGKTAAEIATDSGHEKIAARLG